MDTRVIARVVNRFLLKQAGPLRDVSKLRFQAVFMMGAGGSGKGFVGERWMKYMPGGGSGGASSKQFKELSKRHLDEAERGLSNLNFEKAVETLAQRGFKIELQDPSHAKIPFQLFYYDEKQNEREILPSEWAEKLPPQVYNQVKGLEQVVFTTPVHELPSYWRQVNPDIYKEELAGYVKEMPGYVHEMSSGMSKSYFQAILETGDPLFVDGTGSNPQKMSQQMEAARKSGYHLSLVYVLVPLTVNLIRNATRARNVDAMEIVSQWQKIQGSFHEIRGIADKVHVVLNRNDKVDVATYRAQKERIDMQIRKSTNGRYDGLFDIVKHEAPKELAEWGALLKPEAEADSKRVSPMPPEQGKMPDWFSS